MKKRNYYNEFLKLGQQKINYKKLCNNTAIEIDHCSPLELLKLQKNLLMIVSGVGMEFVYEKGVVKRQTCSIQTEGHFGDIKENEKFRRFNYHSSEKVYRESMLYAMGRNINKYYRFLHDEIRKFEGKIEQKTA